MTDGAMPDGVVASDAVGATHDVVSYDVVIPTLGRSSLRALLASLARATGPLPGTVFVVDDRPRPAAHRRGRIERRRAERSSRSSLSPRADFEPLRVATDTELEPLSLGTDVELDALKTRIRVIAGCGAGPASARNRGWQQSRAPWVAFLDDDVVVDGAWRRDLQRDLSACDASTAGSQGCVHVPLPHDRAPTDWERNVRSLEDARWITADCAYRRDALRALDGFDERFVRAYREDADFAVRLHERGWTIAHGTRRVDHPVRSADPWISVRLQAGNADDALMEALHGSAWRELAGAPRGAFAVHVRTVAFGVLALVFATLWLASTLRFAWERIAPGPRGPREIGTMLATSVAIPFAAVCHRLRGTARAARLRAAANRNGPREARRATHRARFGAPDEAHRPPDAVLFDRDGTLIVDEPALRDPAQVTLVAGARAALDRLRRAGIAVGIVTNQPCVGDGRITHDELAAVHERLQELAGPFATIAACTHRSDEECACRKPQPALVQRAAERLGIDPRDCIVVGDIGADVAAATAAGARAILVPNAVTLPAEIAAAPIVARDLRGAVDCILAGRA